MALPQHDLCKLMDRLQRAAAADGELTDPRFPAPRPDHRRSIGVAIAAVAALCGGYAVARAYSAVNDARPIARASSPHREAAPVPMPQLESNLAPAPQPESNPAPAPMTQPRAAAPWRPELAPPRAPAPRPIDKPSVQRRTNAPGGVVHRDPVEFVPRDPQGELDMSIVRQYIRRSEAKIRYCYEAQLLANPTLAGTVQTHFAIASSGAVASATATGLDGQVASCVAEVIKAIVFPSSESGAQIKYPFHFVKSEW